MVSPTITSWRSAAAYTGRAVAALRRMVAAGELAASQDGGGRYVFSAADLNALRLDRPTETGAKGNTAGPNSGPARKPSPQLNTLDKQIYADLDERRDLHEIALARGASPAHVRRLAAEWSRLLTYPHQPGEFAELVGNLEARAEGLEVRSHELADQVQDLRVQVDSLMQLVMRALERMTEMMFT